MAFTLTTSVRRVNDLAAHQLEVKLALKAAADALAAKASGVLSAHRHSGDSEINVTHGSLDYFVNLDDQRGQHAAAAIEFGHIAPNGRFVPGIHALTGGLG